MAAPSRLRNAPPETRRKAVFAVRLWAGFTLGSMVLLVALVVWHMIRRGRLLRDNLAPVRGVPPLVVPDQDA